MFRYFALLLSFSFTVIFTSCVTGPAGPEKKEDCRIGVNLPLTGMAASWGSELRKGLDAAFAAYNDTTSTHPALVIYEDNQFNARQAVNITKKFLEVDQVSLVMTGYTPLVKATMDMVNQAGTPFLATLTSAGGITEGKPWVFRDFILESAYMPVMADFAFRSDGLRKGSSLVVNDDFGLDALRFFSEPFESLGGKMIPGAVFEESELDLRNKVSKILSDDPDFILLVGRGSAMINGARQIREINPAIPIYSAMSINYEEIWKGLGPAGDGIVFAGFPVDTLDTGYKNLDRLFNRQYGRSPNWINIYGYTTGVYLCALIHGGATDKEKLKDALTTLDTESLRGKIIMNPDREVVTPLKVFRRVNGRNIQSNQ